MPSARIRRLQIGFLKGLRKLVDALEDIQDWEAELIETNECWQGNKGLPKFNQKLYDYWIQLQTKRNKLL